LSSGNDNAAYRCGRLLAVLEEVQEAAIGTGTIVDRFFGTASSAPASVFGRLLRGAQPHLSKLHRDKRAAHDALQRRLEEVQSGLTAFPRTLTLEDQGMFSLGYYHQRAWDRAQRIENAARRKQANAIEEPDAALLDEDDIDGGDAE
jgi:CRISPR-associated protein Csd1